MRSADPNSRLLYGRVPNLNKLQPANVMQRKIFKVLKQANSVFNRYMSTSPEVEPDNFCDHIRATLQFIANNPDPVETVFKDNKPLKYQKKGEAWAQIRSS